MYASLLIFFGFGNDIPIVLRSHLQQMPCHTRHPICTRLDWFKKSNPKVCSHHPLLLAKTHHSWCLSTFHHFYPFLSISMHFYPFLSISCLAPPKKATHPEHVVSARFCVENMVGCLPIHNDPQSTINRYGQTGQN